MKFKMLLLALCIGSTILTSCTNSDTEEELQLMETIAEGDDPDEEEPATPPPPPNKING